MATTENEPAARNDNFVGFAPKLSRVVAIVLMYIENSSYEMSANSTNSRVEV